MAPHQAFKKTQNQWKLNKFSWIHCKYIAFIFSLDQKCILTYSRNTRKYTYFALAWKRHHLIITLAWHYSKRMIIISIFNWKYFLIENRWDLHTERSNASFAIHFRLSPTLGLYAVSLDSMNSILKLRSSALKQTFFKTSSKLHSSFVFTRRSEIHSILSSFIFEIVFSLLRNLVFVDTIQNLYFVFFLKNILSASLQTIEWMLNTKLTTETLVVNK